MGEVAASSLVHMAVIAGLVQAEGKPSGGRDRRGGSPQRRPIARGAATLPRGQTAVPPSCERVYRELRASFESRKDHPRASGFYFAEMEMRRLTAASGRLGQTLGSLTAWYGLISGYGERWARPLLWFAGVWLLWGVLYLAAGLWIKSPSVNDRGVGETSLVFVGLAPAPSAVPSADGWAERLGHALLHSFLVATLIGRDVHAQPINALGQGLQTLEVILGPLLLALMGLAVRRRFQR
jgi:hypothetical protein